MSSSCKQIWCMCERAGAPFKLFLHLMAWPSQVIRKRALLGCGGPSGDQTLLVQWCCMQCWQHALWGTELHIHPSTPMYHSLSSPLQGGLQFRCQAWYLFCISLFCSVPQQIQCFHLLETCILLWAVPYSCSNYVSLWRIHFSLNSHPIQSPLSSITFSKDAPFAKCIRQWSIPIKGLCCRTQAFDIIPFASQIGCPFRKYILLQGTFCLQGLFC